MRRRAVGADGRWVVRDDHGAYLDCELRVQLRRRSLDDRSARGELGAEVATLQHTRVDAGHVRLRAHPKRPLRGVSGEITASWEQLHLELDPAKARRTRVETGTIIAGLRGTHSLSRFSFCVRSFFSWAIERFQNSPCLRVRARSVAKSFLISESSASSTTQCDSSVETTPVRS